MPEDFELSNHIEGMADNGLNGEVSPIALLLAFMLFVSAAALEVYPFIRDWIVP